MKILEEGRIPAYKSRCGECRTLFEYERSDISYKFLGACYGVPFYLRTVKCPKCSVSIEIPEPDDD